MVEAFILGKVEPTTENEVISELQNLQHVSWAALVYGRYDVIAKFSVPNKKLKEIARKISRTRGLIARTTLITCTPPCQ
jgi:hypothetical protein